MERYGADLSLPEWSERLVYSACGTGFADFQSVVAEPGGSFDPFWPGLTPQNAGPELSPPGSSDTGSAMQIQSRSGSPHGFNQHLPSGGLSPHVTLRPVGDLALECREKGTDWRVTLTMEDVTNVIWCALTDYAFRAQIQNRFKRQKSPPFEIVELRAPQPTPHMWPIPQPERRAPIEHSPVRQPERRVHIERRPIDSGKGSLLPKMPVPDHCRRDDQTVKPMIAEFV